MDFAGLNIRTPADPVAVKDIFQALGAATPADPVRRFYIPPQQGVVDGAGEPAQPTSPAPNSSRSTSSSPLTGHQSRQSTPFLMSTFAQAKVTPEQLEIDRRQRQKRPATSSASLWPRADVKLLAEFKANPDVVVNEPDRPTFQAATAGVIEKYKGESYGDFVTEVLAAAGAA